MAGRGYPNGTLALTPARIHAILAGLLLGMFLSAVDQTIVSTALPTIVSEFGGIERIYWVPIAYVLTSTASTPLYGKLSDLFGRRIIFQVATAVFLLGSVLAGISGSLLQLVVFRGVQGIGGGGILAMAFTIVADILPPRQRGRYIGWFTAVFAVAGVVGPLLGGFFVDHLSWRWIFYINLPLGLLSLVITSAYLRLPALHRRQRIDYAGAVLLVGAVTCLVLITTWGGNAFAWGSRQLVGLALAGVLLVALFLLQELRSAAPILPLALFRNPVIAVTAALSFIIGAAMFGALVFLPLFLQAVKGLPATLSGLLLAPMSASLTVASVVTGRLTTRTGRYKHWVVLGAVFVTVAMAALTRLDLSSTSAWVVGSMVTLGLGLGMILPILNLAAQNAVRAAELGVATTAVTFARTLGGSLGMAGFGAALRAHLGWGLGDLAARGSLPAGVDAGSLTRGVDAIRALAEPLRSAVLQCLAGSIAFVYEVAVPFALLGFVLSCLLKELPLQDSAPVRPAQPDEGTPEPAPDFGA
ncbi:MAG: MFS transporter [Deltaproteobacteria bacterium]|nr:MFS transporter [Deltaproteobacteria bacterium]